MRRLAVLLVLAFAGDTAAALADPSLTPSRIEAIPQGTVHSVVVDGDTAYVGGDFRHAGPRTGGWSKVDPGTGRVVPGLPVVNGIVFAAAADGSGGWYVGGYFSEVGGVPRPNLAHVEADGTIDPAWAPSPDGPVRAIAVAGPVVWIGGEFDNLNGANPRHGLAAISATDGSTLLPAPTMAGGATSVFALELKETQIDSRLYVGGSFTTVDGNTRPNLVALNPATGAVDTAFDPRPAGLVVTLEVLGGPMTGPASWNVYLGGDFGGVLGPGAAFPAAQNRVARVNGATGLGDGGWTSPQTLTGAVLDLEVTPTRVYIGGNFAPSAGVRGLAGLDPANGTLDGYGADLGTLGSAAGLLVRDGTVYFGGSFASVDGEPRTDLAAVDAGTSTVTPWDPEPLTDNLGMTDIVADGTSMVVMGSMSAVGGEPRGGVAAYDLATGDLLPLNPDVAGPVFALAQRGGTLYAGGRFDTVGAVTRHNLAAFDAATGAPTAFDPDVDGQVRAVAAGDAGVYAAGFFTTVNGATLRAGLAGFDPGTGVARSFSPALAGGQVNALAADGTTVYLGGNFAKVNGDDRLDLASVVDIPPTTGLLTAMRADTDGLVHALRLAGPTLYAGGSFANVSTVAHGRLVAIDAATGALRLFAASADQDVFAVDTIDGQAVAGGRFDFAGGMLRTRLAAFDAGTGALSAWDTAGANISPRSIASSAAGGIVVGGDPERGIFGMDSSLHFFAIRPGAPAAPQGTAGDGSATVTVAEPPDGGAPVTSYTVTAAPGGATQTGAAGPFTFAGLANGTAYTFTATATNRVGTSDASPASAPVTPGPAPAPTATATPGGSPTPTAEPSPTARPTPEADTTPPRIERLSMTRRRVRTRGRRRGTAFRFELSEAADVSVRIQRKRRKRFRRVGALAARPLEAGANRIRFKGRIKGRRLPRARYRATLLAFDEAGNASAPARIRFRVVRRPRH